MSLKLIGKSFAKPDALAKVTGEAVYYTDFTLPGMFYGKILRSPHAHAEILSIDTSKAWEVPGVKAVITYQDAPSKKYGQQVKDEQVFAASKVRYVGDEVAAVAATSEKAAKEALDKIQVNYRPLPAVLDPVEAMSPEAPVIHDQPGNIAYSSHVKRGEVDTLLNKSDYVVEGYMETPAVHAMYLEPFSALAQFQGGKLNLWIPVQNPFIIRNLVAEVLSLPKSKVRVFHQLAVGGGFGAKLDSKTPVIAALLAQKTGKPVRVVHTREEDLAAASRCRVPVKIKLTIGVNRDGTLTGKKAEVVADNGAYSSLAPKIICTNLAIRSDNLYRFQAVETTTKLVYTNRVPSGAYRGYGNPQMHFALESLMDMAAEKIGMDPVALRLKNAAQENDLTIHGWKLSSCGLSQCLEQGMEKFNWQEKLQKYAVQQGKRRRGVGMAAMVHVSGNKGGNDYHGSQSIINMTEDGRVQVLCAEVEIGQGSKTVLAQIVANELGIPFEWVEMIQVDTDTAPFIYGAFSSRTTHIGGNAVLAAAREVKKQLFALVAEQFAVTASELALQDGNVINTTTGTALISIQELANKHQFSSGGKAIIGHGAWDPDTVLLGEDKYGNISSGYSFATHFVEVEVDQETGRVEVIDYLAVHDSGTIINPLLAEGQVEGGVVQGLGYALTEQYVFGEDGKLLNDNLADYKVFTAEDAPPITSIFVNTYEPNGPTYY